MLQQFGKWAIPRAFAIELVLLLALSGYYRDLNKDRKEESRQQQAKEDQKKRTRYEHDIREETCLASDLIWTLRRNLSMQRISCIQSLSSSSITCSI